MSGGYTVPDILLACANCYVEGRGVDGSGSLDGLPMFERGE